MKRTALFFALAVFLLHANAQTWPTKPVKFIVPSGPGGTIDPLGRFLADIYGRSFGQNFIIENRPGAQGNTGIAAIARAESDGYTIGIAASSMIAINPHVYKAMPYDPRTELTGIVMVGDVPNILVVHPDVPVKTLAEFIAYAKANPGKLNFSSGGNGTIPHMGGALLNLRAGLNMQHVPFKGGADSLTALLGGQVQMTIDGGPHVIGHIRSGALRMLGVATLQRLAEFPNTPTIAESGIPGFESNAWQSLWVTGGTPAPVVKKISTEVMRILRTPEMVERLRAMGMTPIGGTPEEAEAFIRAETTKWGAVIKASGAKAE